MASPVERYQKLDQRIAGEEAKLESITQQLEADKWEQCRIVHEAITSKAYSRLSFSKAIGTSDKPIAYRFSMWEQFGHESELPLWSDAYAAVRGQSQGAERTREMDIQGVKKATAEDIIANVPPAVIAQVVAQSPDAARAVGRNIVARQHVNKEVDADRASTAQRDISVAKGHLDRMDRSFSNAIGTDAATSDLRQAAAFIASAVSHRLAVSIAHPEAEAKALADIKHALDVYRAAADGSSTTITEADEAFLDSLGIDAEVDR